MEEQRSQAGAPAARFVRGGVETGCSASRMPLVFHHGLLACAGVAHTAHGSHTHTTVLCWRSPETA